MLKTRITEYKFLDCTVQLAKEKGAYWVLIKCINPSWELTTSYPQSCPTKALMAAELTILRRRIKASLSPTFAFNFTKNGEIFHLANCLFEELFGEVKDKKTQEFFDLGEYRRFLNCVRSNDSHTGILRICGRKALVEMSLISPISLTRRVYGKIIKFF